MYDCAQKLAEYIRSHPLRTDGTTALDMLYTSYIAHSAIDSQAMACKFRQLEQRLSALPPEQENGIFQTFCEVYAENEKNAFCEGLRFGFQLAKELAGE
ncbi:MAG: hypothetical protein Q4D50_03880 [Eubacteriales bacterium]|nr:hypothetical protein [Eubacteriales bacterium]